MPTERPLLTARWTELLVLNFLVPPELLEQFPIPGTQLDLYAGQAYISIVGFRFQNTRLFGLPIPGHTRFTEINLRYYVRRVVDGQLRRGVVFVKELVPRRALAATANWLYNESYFAGPMRSEIQTTGSELSPGDTVEYAWRNTTRPGLRSRPSELRWNRLAGQVASPLQLPAPGSLDEFIVEHYWGYVTARDGDTREYRVRHDPWRVAPISDAVWDCDLASYETPWREHLAGPPVSALIAEGSPVQVFRGRRLK